MDAAHARPWVSLIPVCLHERTSYQVPAVGASVPTYHADAYHLIQYPPTTWSHRPSTSPPQPWRWKTKTNTSDLCTVELSLFVRVEAGRQLHHISLRLVHESMGQVCRIRTSEGMRLAGMPSTSAASCRFSCPPPCWSLMPRPHMHDGISQRMSNCAGDQHGAAIGAADARLIHVAQSPPQPMQCCTASPDLPRPRICTSVTRQSPLAHPM